ncbi:MAG: hypothetical protein IJX28_08275 [Clostridia bacterium]|nr:hypothetical protein [Clostridia bacterium]
MKKQGFAIMRTGISILLCCVLLLGVAVPLLPSVRAEGITSPDYRAPGVSGGQSLTASQIYEQLFDHPLAQVEAAYLDTLSELTLLYSNLIPESVLTTHYNGEAGTLDVSVSTYSYTANNGVTVTWVPQSVTLGETTLVLTEMAGSYTCQFGGLLYSDDFDVTVDFTWEATLPADFIDTLRTRAYTDGSVALETLRAYENGPLADYLAALERYEVYQAYLQAIRDREQYLTDLEAYRVALAAYEVYVADYQAYTLQMEAYLARQKYEADLQHYYDYQNFLKNDLEKYNQYLLYQNQVDVIWKKLSILEALFTHDSNRWQMYGSIMGDTVTTVVARKAELITAGCNAQDIESAGAATVRLRPLLKGYADLRQATYASEHERIAALYAYYTENYAALRDTYAQLYGALISLYDNEFVVVALNSKGKLAHFQQFMGQMYVTVTCLDDSEKGIRMENWKISGKTLAQVVEPLQLLPDTIVADPTGVLMPATAVEKVEAVTPIEKPTVEPPKVEKPTEPARVEKPVEPTYVASPDTSNPPAEATHPGAMPPKPTLEPALELLAEEIRAGRVVARAPLGEVGRLRLEKTVTCSISIQNLKTVTFYDYDGVTVLDQQKVDYGQSVSYGGPSVKKEDGKNIYEFLGWILADGSPAVFGEVRGNLSVFANYKITPRIYRITWILDGVEQVTYCRYGETPVSPFPLTKPDGADHSYVFSGWDIPVSPVTGDATYVGSFTKTPHLYTVTWVVGEQTVTQRVEHGTYPVYPGGTPTLPADDYLYTFQSWDRSLLMPVTADVTFTASFQKKPLATSASGVGLSVLHSDTAVTVTAGNSTVNLSDVANYAASVGKDLVLRWNALQITVKAADLSVLTTSQCKQMGLKKESNPNGEVLTLRYLNQSGKEIDPALPLTAQGIPQREDGSRYAYYFPAEGGWSDTAAESGSAQGALSVLVKPVYALRIEKNEFCHTEALIPNAAQGDWVSLELAHEAAYEISDATVTLADGTRVAVTRDPARGLGFFMPGGDVEISLILSKIVYHVTFLVNGRVYAEQDYAFGEQILAPADPSLPSDGVYTYVFTQWSPALALAVGEERSLTFEAVFSKTLLEGEDPYHSGNDNNRFLTTYLPIGLGVIALGVGGFFFLRYRKKKKALTLAVNATEDTPTEVAQELPEESPEGTPEENDGTNPPEE